MVNHLFAERGSLIGHRVTVWYSSNSLILISEVTLH